MLRGLFASPRQRKSRQVAPCQALERRIVPSGTSEVTGEGAGETDGAPPSEPQNVIGFEWILVMKRLGRDVSGKPPDDPHSSYDEPFFIDI